MELAWAAGFFDGEGSVGCYETENGSKFRSPRLNLQVCQTSPDVLIRFANAVGVGRVRGPYGPKAANSSPYWSYGTEAFQNVQQVVASLWPMLSQQKRDDIRRSFATYYVWAHRTECQEGHTTSKQRNGKPYCPTCSSAAANKRWSDRRKMLCV